MLPSPGSGDLRDEDGSLVVVVLLLLLRQACVGVPRKGGVWSVRGFEAGRGWGAREFVHPFFFEGSSHFEHDFGAIDNHDFGNQHLPY